MRRLTLDQARRMALAAQGLADPRPTGRVDSRHFRRVVDRIGLVQLDSVNVVARAHYFPFLARLGPYSREALDRWLWGSGEMFEYWAHMASLVPAARRHLFQYRMASSDWHWVETFSREEPGYINAVLEEVRLKGPLTVADLDDPGDRTGPWWGYGKGKTTLEWLFIKGQVAVSHRVNFVRQYDLPERVHPPEVLEQAVPTSEEARRELLRLAVRHHGLGTLADIADYYRQNATKARPLLADLVRTGEIEEVEVDGWKGPVYADPEAILPRRIEGRALLCPFDPVMWFRPRTERLFDFHYRIEIYVPEPQRKFGYYVLPFLLDGRLVARVDLKAHRATGVLAVRAAHSEPEVDRLRVAAELAGELSTVAGWLGLSGVVISERGDLSEELAAALR